MFFWPNGLKLSGMVEIHVMNVLRLSWKKNFRQKNFFFEKKNFLEKNFFFEIFFRKIFFFKIFFGLKSTFRISTISENFRPFGQNWSRNVAKCDIFRSWSGCKMVNSGSISTIFSGNVPKVSRNNLNQDYYNILCFHWVMPSFRRIFSFFQKKKSPKWP